MIQITKLIRTCSDCRHRDHSGAFTPGGSMPLCSHNDICGEKTIDTKDGDLAVDILVKGGMKRENAIKLIRWKGDNQKEIVDSILLTNGETYTHWIHRVIDPLKEPPQWCPLRHGSGY